MHTYHPTPPHPPLSCPCLYPLQRPPFSSLNPFDLEDTWDEALATAVCTQGRRCGIYDRGGGQRGGRDLIGRIRG